jgi:hypothetical protein
MSFDKDAFEGQVINEHSLHCHRQSRSRGGPTIVAPMRRDASTQLRRDTGSWEG